MNVIEMWSKCLSTQKKQLSVFAGIFAISLVLSVTASAELFSPSTQRYITTGENQNWFYIKIHKADNTNDYVAISKNDKGHIGLAVNDEYVGYMFFVPAFQHPVTHDWYVCPLVDSGSYSVNTGQNYLSASGSGEFTCYKYADASQSANVNMTIHELKLESDPQANIKITSNVTVDSAAVPEDTGFAYMFVPADQDKFKYAKVGSSLEDFTENDRDLSLDKSVEFFDSLGKYIGHSFYWTDMPVANNIMRVATYGGDEGILMGTYGYGSGRNIYVDPLYTVDYSPEPAEHLIGGNVTWNNNSQFDLINNITIGVSDSSDLTSYDTNIYAYRFFNTTNDTYMISSSPNTNYGNDSYVIIGRYLGAVYDTLLNHDIDQGFSNMLSAKLVMYDDIALGFANISIQRITESWNESDATWNNKPSVDPYIWSQINITDIGFWEWDITELVKSIMNGTYENYGFYLNKTNPQDNNAHRFYTREFSPLYTYIIVEYVDPDGKAITGKWNQTYDPDYEWFLRVRKITNGTHNITVHAYDDNNTISTFNHVNKTLIGSGWFNINVSSLVEYETNVAGLSYTQLRFSTFFSSNFSEIFLRKEINDTELPVFEDCQVDNTNLTNNEIARFQCNVTDNIDVDNVNGTIEGIIYDFTRNDDVFYYDFICLDTNPSIDWTLVAAEDISGNYNSTSLSISVECTYVEPAITIISPSSKPYYLPVELNVTADDTIDTWWYSINHDSNVTFVPNTTIVPEVGFNNMQVFANNTGGYEGSSSVFFTYLPESSIGNATITLDLYYNSFAETGIQETIYAIVKNETEDIYPHANVTILIDGVVGQMVYDNTTESYIVYWIPPEDGVFSFTVTAIANNTVQEEGDIYVSEPFEICIKLWNNITMEDPYINQFAWIYAVMPQQDFKKALEHLFVPDENLACPPQGETTCYWHGKYENGTACIDLYETGNYTFYIIGNNIRWEQDIGSGYIADCDFCPPVEIQKRLLLPLGSFYLEESETIDIYVSETELYYRGAFYGVLGSWLWAGIMFVIAAVAFIGVLMATHSLKSAIAALVALPTIIWLLMTFTL